MPGLLETQNHTCPLDLNLQLLPRLHLHIAFTFSHARQLAVSLGRFVLKRRCPDLLQKRSKATATYKSVILLLLGKLVWSPHSLCLFSIHNELHPKVRVHSITYNKATWAQFKRWFIIHWSFNNLAAESGTSPIGIPMRKAAIHMAWMCLSETKDVPTERRSQVKKKPKSGTWSLHWPLWKSLSWSAGMLRNIIWKSWH